LVTGGAGFIGSHLVERLLKLGHKVVVVDNLAGGRLKNINTSAVFAHADISTPVIDDIFEKEKPQVVFHHAAQASVVVSLQDPVRDTQVNVLGSMRMMANAMKHKVEKFVFASTGGAIYGDPQYLPCDENHPPMPLSPYGLSKYVVERYLALFHKVNGLNYTALRYANVYGPRQDPHGEAGVIAIFCRLMLEGERPRIFGTGEQERDFVYVTDVVDANILAMNASPATIYNIGTCAGTSVNQIFDILKDALGYRWKPDYQPARSGEVFKIYLDASRARKELGWVPKVSLEQGLKSTMDYYRQAVRG
jgi:UDP-glucose 4-epimerase